MYKVLKPHVLVIVLPVRCHVLVAGAVVICLRSLTMRACIIHRKSFKPTIEIDFVYVIT